MPFLELFDETLDINSTGNYELSVQISSDEFAFAVIDTIRNKYVLLRCFEPDENKLYSADNLNEIIGKDDFLSKKYKKINLVFPTRKFTLVPAPLFDPGKKEQYFTFNHNSEENDAILSNKISEPDAYVIFSIPQSVLVLAQHFSAASMPYHHTKPLLSQICRESKNTDGLYANVHIEKDFFNLFILDHGILKFSNTFTYRNISDIQYFVLNVFKSMGINNQSTIHFSGHTEKYDDIFSAFAIYVKHIKFVEPAGNFTFSYVFNDVGLHRFINLFSITSCE